MHKIIKITFFLLTIFTAQVFSNSIECDPELRPYLLKMQKVPEVNDLISIILKDGPIKLETNHHHLSQQFGAFWDPDNRLICINLGAHRNEGEVIGSILFEMHNAEANQKLNHLDYLASTRQIQKEKYVESVECIEYYNSKKAAAIAEKGIQMGIFPSTARLPTYKDFAEHYHFQKIGGHSAWIAGVFDRLVHN